jgi:hypothetical protein
LPQPMLSAVKLQNRSGSEVLLVLPFSG